MTEPYVFHPAYAVSARSGLTARNATSWAAGLGRGPRLLVPVDLQALVVGPAGSEVPADIRIGLLEALEQHPAAPGARAPAPFSDRPGPRGEGVYLHWALPDGLTQGRSTGSEGEVGWRPLPNRWLVVRLGSMPRRPRPVRAWVLEADRGGHADLDGWRDGAAGPYRTPRLAPGELTAVGGGDPAWAAVYDNVESRFAFHDDWSDLQTPERRDLAYVVVGWYSRAALDPLAAPEGADGFDQLLRELGWSVDPERLAAAQAEAERAELAAAAVGLFSEPREPKQVADLGPLLQQAAGVAASARPWWPTQSVYHGVIYGVQGTGRVPADPRPAAPTLRTSVGATAAEGVAALVADRLGDPDAELIQAAFGYGLADVLGDPDGLPRLEEELHARAFVARPGGETAERVVAGDPFADLRPTTPPTPASDAALTTLPDRSVRFTFSGGGDRVADLLTLTTRPDKVAPPPDPRRVEDTRRPLPRWLAPQDPVVVVGGLRRSLRHGYDGRFSPDETLACRLSGDTVTKLAGLVDGRELIARQVEHGAVPAEAGALVIEAAVEDPFADYGSYVEEFAGRHGLSYQALLDALDGEASLFVWSLAFPSRGVSLNALSLKDGVGASPAGITIWRQAWVPLFLEWELQVDLDATLAGWDLDELDYQPPPGAGLRPGQAEVLAGRSLLVSASARTLADQVSAFLAEEDKLDLRGEGRVGDDLEARLRALAASAGLIDVLTAGLDGLRERLLGFTQETALGASGDPQPPAPTAQPRPLRAGFARLQRLRVVDAFGRTITLVGGGQAAPAPVLGGGLRTATAGELLLRPRLNQPARLLLRMVDAADDSHEAGVDQAAGSVTPLAGWLLADHADGAVELFDPEGAPLGQLMHDGLTGAVVWEGPPGARAPVGTPPDAALGGDARLRHLHAMVAGLLRRDALERAAGTTRSDTPLEALLRVIDTTSATVGLGGQTGSEHVAQLVGRPIAVVRATLRLDVEPEPDFPTLPAADRAARAAAWAALAGRAFPVHLGALTRLDDGLLGFWVDDDYGTLRPVHPSVLTRAVPSGRHRGDFAALGAGSSAPRPIQSPSVLGDPTVMTRPGQSVRLTLLMDPAARIHATCGLLPRKAIGLLRDWFAEALERVVPSFRVGPALVDPATIRMPLAAALGRGQAWVRRDGPASWRDDPIVAATQQALLPDTAAVVQEGYLRVAFEQQEEQP